MLKSSRKRYPWVVCGALILLSVGGAVLFVLNTERSGSAGTLPPDWQWSTPIVAVLFPLAGAFALRDRHRRILGWLLISAGLIGIAFFAQQYAAYAHLESSANLLPGTTWAAWVSVWLWIPALLPATTVLLLLVPSGRPAVKQSRPLIAISIALTAVATVSSALAPGHLLEYPTGNPIGIDAFPVLLRIAELSTIAMMFGIAPLCLAALVLQLREVDLLQQKHMRWIAIGAFAALLARFAGRFGAPSVFDVIEAAGFFGMALSIIVAIVRDPLHAGERAEIERDYAVLAQLGHFLESAVLPDSVLTNLVDTIASALRLPYVAVELGHGDDVTAQVVHGSRHTDVETLQLLYQNEVVGRLIVGRRKQGEPLDANDVRLLRDLAGQAGVAAHVVRLTEDLRRSGTDLQRSRERLVTAVEEERRRLRRDLHDGLGSTLAGISVSLKAVRNFLSNREVACAEDVLVNTQFQLQGAMADIRQVVNDLRPAVLDQLGLVNALRERAAIFQRPPTDLKITLEVPDDLSGLPAAVEVAAYRIGDEALANVSRHSKAHNCRVVLLHDEGLLQLEVIDDGIGLGTENHIGTGLLTMRERAAELGGTLSFELAEGGGCRVMARLPLVAR